MMFHTHSIFIQFFLNFQIFEYFFQRKFYSFSFISLLKMLVIPLSSLPLKRQNLLAKSPLNPPMYALIEGHHYDIELNVIFYNIQIGIQKGEDVICSMIKLRYSELEKFQKTLIGSFPDLDLLYKFPPKKWFNNTSETFILEREKGLQTFLSSVFAVPSITETDSFKSLFKIKRRINP